MSQPISQLYDRITDFFAAGHLPGQLEQAIQSGKLSRAIFIDPEPAKARTPYANLDDKEIKLQATFLSYLWSFCYCMIRFQQMTIDQIEAPIVRLRNSSEAPILNVLFDWANSLRDTYSDWPTDLPTPGQDSQRILEADALFLFAIRYLMFHEVGHLILHESSADFIRREKRNPSLSAEDSRRFRMMELQADDFAIDTLLAANTAEPHRYMNMVGAAIAQLASLFLLKDDDLRGGRTHPDFDERLKRLAKKASFSEQQHTLFFDGTISIGLQVFFERYAVDFLPVDSEAWRLTDFSDLFDMLYQKIDERKALYVQHRPFI